MALDLILADAEVIDGTGRPSFRADVGIEGDRITAIAPRLDRPSAARVEAPGRLVAPGFIDLHSHSDLCFTLPPRRQAELLEGRVRQGITTELLGNCGIGCAPVSDATRSEVARICGFIAPDGAPWSWTSIASYLDLLESQGVVLNVATLVAHGPARVAAMGAGAARPSAEEQKRLDRLVGEAIAEGAYGVSFGLIYPPGQFADTDELVSVARAAAAAGGFAAFHQRGSSRETLEPAVRELVEVGRRSGIAVHHSHEETVGPRAWPGSTEVLRIEAEAGGAGIEISGDVIPYTAVCTTMLALYPPWSLDGGVAAFLDRLRDPRQRARMKEEVASASPVWPPWEGPGRWTMNISRECGWERIHLAHVDGERHKGLEHLTIAEIGRRAGRDPFDALSDLMLEEQGVATQLIFGISGDRSEDAPLLPFIRDSRLAIVTDAWEIGKGFPHPGAYGAFPRLLGTYVRERRVLTMEEAIRKLTSLPAARLGLRDRGQVREGWKADLVVLDPRTVGDRSTFREPRRPAAGIEEVLINGRRVVAGGVYRPQAAGRVLRRCA
ncbi:MAG TPA: amidohydrolase family protein [Candidatus Polarisedimenticolia bacterium]|nr:amidohydrolase family protein [Candidatus Polarisedimenticolia bacterium]